LWYNIYKEKTLKELILMIFKKKNEPTSTPQDLTVVRLTERRLKALIDLRERAEKVIICNGAVALYPDGADKEKAIVEAEAAKFGLLCAIGVFDDLTNQYLEALAEPLERRTTLDYPTNVKTSHEIIEGAYRDFYKRR
jgi:hypothetical protein